MRIFNGLPVWCKPCFFYTQILVCFCVDVTSVQVYRTLYRHWYSDNFRHTFLFRFANIPFYNPAIRIIFYLIKYIPVNGLPLRIGVVAEMFAVANDDK